MKTVVALENVKFYAYHGYYEQEKKVGNEFEITVKCQFKEAGNEFLNYEILYALVDEVMRASGLDFLEDINKAIIDRILIKYTYLHKIKIKTIKLAPPIARFKGKGTSVKNVWKK